MGVFKSFVFQKRLLFNPRRNDNINGNYLYYEATPNL